MIKQLHSESYRKNLGHYLVSKKDYSVDGSLYSHWKGKNRD